MSTKPSGHQPEKRQRFIEKAREKDSLEGKLLLAAVDKGIFAFLIVVISFVLGWKLELVKALIQRTNQEVLEHQQRQTRDEENRKLRAYQEESERLRARKATIARQLSSFYRPMEARIRRDNAIWRFFYWDEKGKSIRHMPLGEKGDTEILIPNQLEMLRIIDEHGGDIQNDFEGKSTAVDQLQSALDTLNAHVALHRILRVVEDERNPTDIGGKCEWAWPECLDDLIECRIRQLESLHADPRLREENPRFELPACDLTECKRKEAEIRARDYCNQND